jgi:hypothetical protein
MAVKQIITKRGDKIGAWYHFFGVALCAYKGPKFLASLFRLQAKLFVYIERYLFSKTAGIAPQKRLNIDLAGADFGFYLKVLLTKSNSGIELSPSSKYYLNTNTQPVLTQQPQIYGNDYTLKANQLSQFFQLPVEASNEFYNSIEYLKALFTMDLKIKEKKGRNSSVLNASRLFLFQEGEHVLYLLKIYSKNPNDPELNRLIKRFFEKPFSSFEYESFDLKIDGFTHFKTDVILRTSIRKKFDEFINLLFQINHFARLSLINASSKIVWGYIVSSV